MVKHETVDKVGASLSFACAIHCLSLPILCILLPFLGLSFLLSETFEFTLLSFSLLTAVGSICFGIYRHRNCYVLVPLSLGILAVLTAQLYLKGEIFEAIMMCVGGLMLCVSHWINWVSCRKCKNC